MAKIEPCPHRTGNIHIHSDVEDRIVCVGAKQTARAAIRHGTRMGLITQPNYTLLQNQVHQRMDLPEQESRRHLCVACQYPHTYVRGLLDTLDAICGGAPPHPDDVQ